MGCGCGKLKRGQKLSKSKTASKNREVRKKKLINYSLIASPSGRRIKVKKKSK